MKLKKENLEQAKIELKQFVKSFCIVLIIGLACFFIYDIYWSPKDKNSDDVQHFYLDKFVSRIGQFCPGLSKYSKDFVSQSTEFNMALYNELPYRLAHDDVEIEPQDYLLIPDIVKRLALDQPKEYRPVFAGMWFKMQVSETPRYIPSSFRVNGHTCYVGISHDGKYMRIPKTPCISLCLDRKQKSLGHDLVVKFE
ncbi:hypothetical protein DR996_02595 [Vibrio owensii]|nr:hypothetical protein DR996_02595 [Vibrio owensii]